MAIEQKVLLNNTVLITEPIATSRAVAIGFWFSVGSRYENSQEAGISHFVEHLIFKGTSTRSAYDIASAFDKIGGYVNAYTEREQICLQCVIPAEYSLYALDVLCDMAQNATFRSNDINKERTVIESEILSAQDDPEEAALDAVSETVWPKNSISRNICGTIESVRAITDEMLKKWYEQYISNGELVVCVAGNIDQKAIEQRINLLQKHKKASVWHSFSESKLEWKNGVHFIKADFQQEQILLLYPLSIPINEHEYYILAIINALIGDTMSSRLFQILREQGGYCYNVYSFFNICSDCGFWCAYSSSSKEKTIEVVEKIQSEINKILNNSFTQEEIENAKEHLCGEEIIGSEDIESRMKRLFRIYSLGYEQREWEQTVAKIRSISQSDINNICLKLLDPMNKALVIYGPDLVATKKKKVKLLFGVCNE